MTKLLINIICVAFCISACGGDDTIIKDRYALSAFSTIKIGKYGKSTDSTFATASINGKDSLYFVTLRINQFPEYLESFPIRSFAFINDTLIELQILPRDGSRIFLDSAVLYKDLSIAGYPDYYYDVMGDYFYQCSGLRRAFPGPTPDIMFRYGNTFISCQSMDTDSLAQSNLSLIGLQDSFLFSFIQLPFYKE